MNNYTAFTSKTLYSVMCLSADDSVLDGFPLCSPLDAPDINHINQISQMKAHNKVNFIAVVVLALCVVTLLFVSVVGWYVLTEVWLGQVGNNGLF